MAHSADAKLDVGHVINTYAPFGSRAPRHGFGRSWLREDLSHFRPFLARRNHRSRCVKKAGHMTERVFVSSRAESSTELLIEAIRAVGMQPVSIDDVPPGKPIGETLRAAIETADYVLIVWDTAKLPRSVMLEAGYALGARVRVALLDARSHRGTTDDPTVDALLDVPRLHGRLSDLPGLQRELSALRYLSRNVPAPLPQEEAPSNWYRDLQTAAGDSAEARMLSVLQQLKVRVSAERERPLDVPDWNVWVPLFSPPFNPVLVQLAGRKASLKRKRAQLRSALATQGAHLGVLVTLDPVASHVEVVRESAIVEISLLQLEESPQDLFLLLRQARNSLLHGIA
jgi:hypothetical protein